MNNIEKYSGSYGGTIGNFVLLNLRNYTQEKRIDEDIKSILYVLINILQRGEPTKPSKYLEGILGAVNTQKKVALLSEERSIWKNTIKGNDENNFYPAEEFFYSILPEFKFFKEKENLLNLFLPEAYISDILEKSENSFENQRVDFYIPQIKTVIEIDGSSHKAYDQIIKDKTRDKAFFKENVKVVRISTEEVYAKSSSLKSKIENIIKEMMSNENIQEYITQSKNKNNSSNINIIYDAIFRIQILLLQCMILGRIELADKEYNLVIENTDVNYLDDIIFYAYEDIKQWLTALFKLLKKDVKFPRLNVVMGKQHCRSAIYIDFSMYKRYTDEHYLNSKCIYVRTDYYDYKDYYHVFTSETLKYSFVLDGEDSDIPYLKFLLLNLFGHNDFRSGQLQIITHILEKNDTIGILPTGTGKSLCYQFSLLLQPAVSMVIAPIISLMMDQKRGLDNKGITRSNYIASNLMPEEKDRMLKDFGNGKYQVLWISPERFQNEAFRNTLSEINQKHHFSFAVIDEVHCMSEWGHDFRISYLALVKVIQKYCPGCCLLGLTATASKSVLKDLVAEFGIKASSVKALDSMDRDELVFKRVFLNSNQLKSDAIIDVINNLSKTYGSNVLEKKGEDTRSGIIFTPSVKGKLGCNTILNELIMHKEFEDKITVYNGQLSMKEREEIQNAFIDNEFPLLTCTKAFGMGIDKSNVKYTIHSSLPESTEAFYQEAGRAGRDEDKSEKSYCYILYTKENVIDSIIDTIFNPDTKPSKRKKLCEKYLSKDLSTIMYFWNSNKKDVDDEYEDIRNVMKKLLKNSEYLEFENIDEMQILQRALYRLSLLGVIESWTVNYHTLEKGLLKIYKYQNLLEKATEELMLENLLKYIRKYDAGFSLKSGISNYEKYYKLYKSEEKPMMAIIKILLSWSNDNILYSRLMSTQNIMKACDPSKTDETFRKEINLYFRYDDTSIKLDGIIEKPFDFAKWFALLYEYDEETNTRKHFINKETAEDILISLRRPLESYRFNPGLNFLNGFLLLFTNKSTYIKDSNIDIRLRYCMQSIENFDERQKSGVFQELLNAATNLGKNEKAVFTKFLLIAYPGKVDIIYNRLKDDYSLSIILEKLALRLNAVMEGIE